MEYWRASQSVATTASGFRRTPYQFELTAHRAADGQAVTHFNPQVSSFAVPAEDDPTILQTHTIVTPTVQLTIHYAPEKLNGIAEDQLRIYYWNTARSEWVGVLTLIDSATHTARAELDHFTRFALMGIPAAATPAAGSVVLDPDHGGSDPGGTVTSPSAYIASEKDLNLQIATLARANLEACGVQVTMTREDDSSVSLGARAALINTTHPDTSVTIAVNILRHSMSWSTGSGPEAWIRMTTQNQALAGLVLSEVQDQTGLPVRGVKDAATWGNGRGLYVPLTVDTAIPHVQAELAFMDNYYDRAILNDHPEWFANAISNAIFTQLGTADSSCSSGTAHRRPSPLRFKYRQTLGYRAWGDPAMVLEPILASTGGAVYQHTDLTAPNPGLSFAFTRTYNSHDRYCGSMGCGWAHSFGHFLWVNENGEIDLRYADGQVTIFKPNADGSYQAEEGIFDTLTRNGNTYLLSKSDQTIYQFEVSTPIEIGRLVSITERNGNRYALSYDGNDNLATITDPAGRSYTLSYNGRGHLISLNDPLGRSVKYAYDDQDNLTSVTDANGGVTQFVYDDLHHLMRAIDPQGYTFITNTYDDEGRITTQRDASGNEATLSYTSGVSETVVVDNEGQTTRYRYDSHFRPIVVTDAQGHTESYEYDANDNLIRFTDKRGGVTLRTYDAQGNMTAKTDPLGRTTTYEFDASNHLVREVDPLGRETRYSHDTHGNLTRIVDALGYETTITYNSKGQPATLTNPRGLVLSFTYDRSGSLASVSDSLGHTTTYTNDVMGRATRITDPAGYTTAFTYDNLDRITAIKDPRGNTTTYSYDQNGNLSSVTDRRGFTTRFVHNADDKVRQVIDPLGGVTSYTYDKTYHLTSVTDANGHVTSYVYDSLYNLVKVTDRRGGVTTMTYNQAGQVIAITDANGHKLSFDLDAVGQVIKVVHPLGATTQRFYDSGGQLVKEIDPRGATTRFAYDTLGNLTSLTDALDQVTTFTYDPMGASATVTYSDGAVVQYVRDLLGQMTKCIDPLGHTVSYTYDARGNIAEVVDENGNPTQFSYDPNGNLVTRVDALQRTIRATYDQENNRLTSADAKGATISYSYDALGRPLTITNALGATSSAVYDPVGNVIKMVDALGGELALIYDPSGNLVQRMDQRGFKTSFAYDAVNNLLTVTDPRGGVTSYAYDARSRITDLTDAEHNHTRYAYDANGNIVAVTDANGHTTHFTYDLLNRLTITVNARDARTSYAYDPMGRMVKRVDPLGNTYQYSYDLAGRLTKQVDPLGYQVRSVYDPAGNRVQATDANGNTSAFTYDAVYNLVRLVDPKGSATQFAYDGNDNLAQVTSALNDRFAYEYDALNRLVRVTDPLGGVTINTYDALNRLVRRTDAKGGQTNFAYDATSNLTGQTNALGYATNFDYDALGNVVVRTDANSHQTHYVYDLIGRLTQITDPLGYTSSFAYDGVGNVTRTVDKRANPTSYAYDAANNLVTVTDALKGETTSTYDLNNNLTSRTNQNGHTWRYEYNAVNSLVGITLPLGQRTSYTYDGNRNLVRETNAKGHATSYSYDPVNLVTATTDPLNHTTRYEYDALGRMTGQIDALNIRTSFAYDGLGRLTQVTDALKSQTNYSYDPLGNLTTIVDANQHRTEFAVDLIGQVTGETNAVGSTWAYSYDGVGNLVSRQDANGALTNYSYDANDRLVGIAYPDRSGVLFTYDPNANLLKLQDATGTTEAQYDALNRLTQISHTSGLLANQKLAYQYDAASNRTGITYPDGNQLSYAYNENEWLSAVTDPKGGVTSYAYDPVGLPTLIRNPNNTQAELTYDADNRLTRIANHKPETSTDVISTHDYTYDAVDNRTSVLDTFTQGQLAHVRKDYSYDALHRLTGVRETPDFPQGDQVTERYTYDAVGNRLSITTNRPEKNGPPNPPARTITYTYDAANRMLSAGSAQFSYDPNGNRVQQLVAGESKVDYRYDYENRLVQAQGYKALGNGKWQDDYTFDAIYDGMGRRVEKGEVQRGVRKQVDYLMDGWGYDVLAEYPDPGHPVVTQYYRDPSSRILSRLETQGSGDGLQYWYHYDGLGNVTDNTNQQGRAVHDYRYDAYGTVLDINGKPQDSDNWTDPHNHYLWSGKEFDEKTELSYFGSRYYDAQTGTWLTQDSYRGSLSDPQSLHRYAYVKNNPTNLTDRYGFWGGDPCSWFGGKCQIDVNLNISGNSVNFSASADVHVGEHILQGDTQVDASWTNNSAKVLGNVTGAYTNTRTNDTYGLNAAGGLSVECGANMRCDFDAAGQAAVTKNGQTIFSISGSYSTRRNQPSSSNRSSTRPRYSLLDEVNQRFQSGMTRLSGYEQQVTYIRSITQAFDSKEGIAQFNGLSLADKERVTLDYLRDRGISAEAARNTGIAITPENAKKIIERYNDSRPWYQQVVAGVGGFVGGAGSLVSGAIDLGIWLYKSDPNSGYAVLDPVGAEKQRQENIQAVTSFANWAYRSGSYNALTNPADFVQQWQENISTAQKIWDHVSEACMLDKAQCGGRAVFEAVMLIGPWAATKVAKARSAAGLTELAAEANSTLKAAELTGEVNNALKLEEARRALMRANQAAGFAREAEAARILQAENPGATILTQRYLLNGNGERLIDPITGTARRLDFAIVRDGKVVDIREVTSLTAAKGAQLDKTERIRELGDVFIHNPDTGQLIPVGSDVPEILMRLP